MSESTNRPPDSRNSAKRLASTFSLGSPGSGKPTPITDVRKELRKSMDGKFVRKDVDVFIDSFVAALDGVDEPDWSGVFDGVRTSVKDKEIDIQTDMINVININAARICPGYTIKDTSNRADKKDHSKQKIDGGLYRVDEAPADARNCWDTQRVSFEWKREDTSDDPFDDKSKIAFEAASKERTENRGQIISYASEALARQHRCFHFTVVIFGQFARFIRWDRSGGVVSGRFNYREWPDLLCRFLWRFCHLSDKDQGYDPTATRVLKGTPDYKSMDDVANQKRKTLSEVKKTPEWKDQTASMTPEQVKAEEKRAILDLDREDWPRVAFKLSLEDGWPRWKLAVENEIATARNPSDKQPANSVPMGPRLPPRYFLVCKPHFSTSGVAGRGTRGYIALDCLTGKFVFLKDAWRVDMDGIEKEGFTLQMLKNAEVSNIPTVVCHGDVGGQTTLTWSFWDGEGSDSKNPMKKHSHYRLVEEEIGRPISDFDDSEVLFKIVLDCFIAHQDAYELAEILHRDISVGNMLIVYRREEGSNCLIPCGLLNDWELSKSVHPATEGPRQPDRTGTWQFCSAHALDDPHKTVLLQDDLESFFHVLLYLAIRFLPSNCENVSEFMIKYFDAGELTGEQYICGAAKSKAMAQGYIELHNKAGIENLHFEYGEDHTRHPLDSFIQTLLSWFGAYYRQVKRQQEEKSQAIVANRPRRPIPLKSGGALITREHYPRKNARRGGGPDTKGATPSSNDAEDRRLAAQLSSHGSMYDQFLDVADGPWPPNDKVADRALESSKKKRSRLRQVSEGTSAESGGEAESEPEVLYRPAKRTRLSRRTLPSTDDESDPSSDAGGMSNYADEDDESASVAEDGVPPSEVADTTDFESEDEA